MGPTWGPSGADRTQVGFMLSHEFCYLGTFLFAHFISSQTGTINMGVFVILLVVATALRVTAIRCGWFSLTLPYRGRFCIDECTVTRNLLPRQCRYVCLQSATCKAYNYNVTEGTCTRFTSPCPQAFSDPIMEFVVFRETPQTNATNGCRTVAVIHLMNVW